MKLLQIIQCTNLGGMEQSALLLLRELKRLGHQVEVVSLNPLGGLGPLLEQNQIPATGIAYRGYAGWRSTLALRRVLEGIAADFMIMAGHNLMAMLAVGNRWEGRRILSIHYHHRGVKPVWAWRAIYRVATARFPVVVFPSQFILDEAVGIAPFLQRHAKLISYPVRLNTVPTEEQRRSARLALGVPQGSKVVGNAGWLIPRKRWDVFLDTAARIAAEVPEACFLAAGDGQERKALELQARRLGLQNRLRWLGWQSDLATFYRSLDLLVFNSDWDAMGRTPLEAMSYGIPVVASVRHGGLGEIISEPEFAILRRDHDPEELAGEAMKLLTNPAQAAALGQRGRERIREVGSPALHAQRMLVALGAGEPMRRG